MGIPEIVGVCAIVAGAVWTVSEKIGNLKDDMDGRLDEMKARQIKAEMENKGLVARIESLETKNLQWFKKLNQEIYKCTIPPRD